MSDRIATPRRASKPAKGMRQGNAIKVVCLFDDETFEQLQYLAWLGKTSLAEQVRQCVEIGLEERAKP